MKSFAALYKRGIAVGQSDIKTDTMTFEWRNEKFTFPTMKVAHLAFYNGYFFEMRVKRLRALQKEKHG